jgi:2-dehydro-3-deoxyphosphooctonate aldolase (KDO 8-P synthase)
MKIASFPWVDCFFDKSDSFSPLIVSGPCLLEDETRALNHGKQLKQLCQDYDFRYIFKASYEKANRTRYTENSGPGFEKGIKSLEWIRKTLDVPVVTDIHTKRELELVKQKKIDIIQIPAFLCESEDLLQGALESGQTLLIKKIQSFSNREALQWSYKIRNLASSNRFFLCERGTLLRTGNLVLDFRLLDEWIRRDFFTVCDVTHAAQMPSSGEGVTLGLRSKVSAYAKFATILGVHVLFMESHWDPKNAQSDAAVQLSLEQMEGILKTLQPLKQLIQEWKSSGEFEKIKSLFPSEIDSLNQTF